MWRRLVWAFYILPQSRCGHPQGDPVDLEGLDSLVSSVPSGSYSLSTCVPFRAEGAKSPHVLQMPGCGSLYWCPAATGRGFPEDSLSKTLRLQRR